MPYDAIVIGTGFGGTVAAAGLVAAGKNVLMIERGTWWITPETLGSPPTPPPPRSVKSYAAAHNPPHKVQYWPRPDHNRGITDFIAAVRSDANKDGLYQYSTFKEADVLTASGVGGGSLIYSNVNLRPQADVLKKIGLNLTTADLDKSEDFMEKYRGKLQKIVTKIPLPHKNVDALDPSEDYLYLDRSRALKNAAHDALPKLKQQLGVDFTIISEWSPLKLSVLEHEEDNQHKPVGDAAAAHTHCERQGRCILGCLPAARHTLNKTLLLGHKIPGTNQKFGGWIKDVNNEGPNNPAPGVTLVPQAKVIFMRRVGNSYQVTYEDRRQGGHEQTVTAPMVFLAAGVMGTTEILLQSRKKHFLDLSPMLGQKFSTNGDFSGFALGTKNPVYTTRGPINTCDVRVKYEDPLNRSPLTGQWVTVEDCGIPAMLATLVRGALETTNPKAFSGQVKTLWDDPLGALSRLFPHTTDPNNFQTEAEKLANIFFFNANGTDEANGILSLDGDDIDLNWPKNNPVWKNPVFARIESLLTKLTAEMGGTYINYPLWDKFGDHKLVVVHPLGGCPIGPDVAHGVVDEFGRVFDGSKPPGDPNPFHPGLFVVDAAAIPGALAANPTVTIVAQAVKTVEKALGIAIP